MALSVAMVAPLHQPIIMMSRETTSFGVRHGLLVKDSELSAGRNPGAAR